MRSTVFSLLFCALYIYQSYSLSLAEHTPEQFKNHAACLEEQKLDLSLFGISIWNEWDEDLAYFKLRRTLDENKRNMLLAACLLYSKPIYNAKSVIIKNEDGTYEIDPTWRDRTGKRRDDRLRDACIKYNHDLYKTVGCWYEDTFKPEIEEEIIKRRKH